MSLVTRRLNCPPTSAETVRLQRFIVSREKELEIILLEILEEEKQVKNCEDAIWNLESAIPIGKDAVKMHEDNLSALTQIQSRLSEYSLVSKLEPREEVHSRGLYEEMKQCADILFNRSLGLRNEPVTLFQDEVRTLWDRVRHLEIELEGWKTSHALSQDTLKRHRVFKTGLEADLKAAKASFRPFLKVPADIWPEIFRMVVFGEFEDYVKNNAEVPLRSAALVLSQVCQSWRQILALEPDIWSFVTAHASQYWTLNKYSLFTHCTAKTSSPFTIMANISQTLCWMYNQVNTNYNSLYGGYDTTYKYQNHLGQEVTIANPDWNTALASKQYKLHINMSSDQIIFTERAPLLRFYAPTELTLSSRLPIQHGYIFNFLSHFRATKSLVIINDDPANIPAVNFASTLPQLTTINFRVKTFPITFQIAGFLTATLESLYLRHENPASFGLTAQVTLPRLKTLGITSPGSSFFQWVRMPSLRRMIFYSPMSFTAIQPSHSDVAVECYKKLLHLQFEEWRRPREDEGSLGVISFFRELVVSAHHLQSIKFSRSWIDGEGLLTILDSGSQAVDPGSLAKLQVITLDRTTGITRDECDLLKGLVKKLNIFV